MIFPISGPTGNIALGSCPSPSLVGAARELAEQATASKSSWQFARGDLLSAVKQAGTLLLSVLGVALLWVVLSHTAKAADLRIESVGLSLVHEATIAAPEPGAVVAIPVREGQVVKAGELLVQLDDTQAQKELAEAQIKQKMALLRSKNDVKLRLARTSLELAQIDLRRAKESNTRYANSVTAAKLDRFRLTVERGLLDVEQEEKDLETARLAFAAAQNAVDLAEASLQRRKITAPIDGQVVEIKRRKGEWVQPGEPVVRIVQRDVLRAEAFVLARDLVADISGRSIVFLAEVPGQGTLSFRGSVTFVSPEVNPINGQVQVWAEITNRNTLLRPGSLGTLIILSEGETAPGPTEPSKDHKDAHGSKEESTKARQSAK